MRLAHRWVTCATVNIYRRVWGSRKRVAMIGAACVRLPRPCLSRCGGLRVVYGRLTRTTWACERVRRCCEAAPRCLPDPRAFFCFFNKSDPLRMETGVGVTLRLHVNGAQCQDLRSVSMWYRVWEVSFLEDIECVAQLDGESFVFVLAAFTALSRTHEEVAPRVMADF